MNTVLALETIGYTLSLSNHGQDIKCKKRGQPDPILATTLLAELKRNKGEAIRFLQERSRPLPHTINVNSLARAEQDWIQRGYRIAYAAWPLDQVQPTLFLERIE